MTNDEIEALEKWLCEPKQWSYSNGGHLLFASSAPIEAAAAIAHLRAEVERLTRERACRDALIDDHLRKIMHLENRIEEEVCKAQQLEADLKHVQGSDIGLMKLLHAEKLKTDAAERQVATLRAMLREARIVLGPFGFESFCAKIDDALAKEPPK